MGTDRQVVVGSPGPRRTPRGRTLSRALFGTCAGRLIVTGTGINLLIFALGFVVRPLPALIRAIDTGAALAVAAGAGFFLFRGLEVARRVLLWRVRRKLILSYIFMGFVPALLIAGFFLLGGLLLFSHFSSYLVQTRLRSLADRAQWLAEATAWDSNGAAGQRSSGFWIAVSEMRRPNSTVCR